MVLVYPGEPGLSEASTFLERLAHVERVVMEPPSHLKRWRQFLSVVFGRSYLLHLFHRPAMQRAIDKQTARIHYDAVLFESVLLAGYQLPAVTRRIIDQHNIEHELLWRTSEQEHSWIRKWYNWQEGRLVRHAEIARCREADILLVTSERERIALQNLLPDTASKQIIEVIPNGVDVETFTPSSQELIQPGRLVFTGAMDYFPNIQAALFFAEHCWPLIRARLPGATWEIVGKNPPPEVRRLADQQGISVTGTVRDVRPYLARAAVAIAPLLVGSGTRLKILEAFAMRKAVVSTNIGCEGLDVEHRKHLLIEDQPEAFAQAVVTLLNDIVLRTSLGTAGRALVEDRYSWRMCGDRLLRLLEEKEKVLL